MYNLKYECDDVRDIIINVNNFNNNNYLKEDDQLIECDINRMYDNISLFDVKIAFNIAINEALPFNFTSESLINLWEKLVNHVFKYCYFE